MNTQPHSFREGATRQPVRIADLVPGLARPDYPPMPKSTDPVPMPPRG